MLKNAFLLIFTPVALCVMLTSCGSSNKMDASFSKRKFLPGKFVQGNKEVTKIKSFYTKNSTPILQRAIPPVSRKEITEKKSKSQNRLPEECDVLTLKSGDVLLVSIISANQKEITYTNCNDPNGTKLNIAGDQVFFLRYKNGDKVNISDLEMPVSLPPPSSTTTKSSESKKTSLSLKNNADKPESKKKEGHMDPMALWAMFFTYTFFLSPIGLLLANRSVDRINGNPGKYTGIKFASKIQFRATMACMYLMILGLILVGVLYFALIVF